MKQKLTYQEMLKSAVIAKGHIVGNWASLRDGTKQLECKWCHSKITINGEVRGLLHKSYCNIPRTQRKYYERDNK